MIEQETKDLIDRLLLEKLLLAGIALSYWCIRTMVALHMLIRCIHRFQKMWKFSLKKGRLTIQCDVICGRSVANKKNKQWIGQRIRYGHKRNRWYLCW